MKKIIYILFFFVLVLDLNAQKKMEHIALINATAHIGNGKLIQMSLVVINKDKIETVSDIVGIKLNHNNYDTVIDLSGKHIYPALINCNNILGLHDAEAIRATLDYAELGVFNPHIRSLIAYNTDNLIIPTVKTNGVLYTQVTPRGGLISGSSSVMALEGWNWEDAVLKADDGIHLNFPRLIEVKWSEEDELTKKRNNKYKDELEQLHRFFQDAQAYCKQSDNLEKNIRFEAMRPVFAGMSNLYLHADRARDILSVINFVNQHKIKKPVLVGAKDGYKVLSEIKRSRIPVMLCGLNDLPEHSEDDVDIVFRLPALFQKDSILFCLQLEGGMEAMQSRNLPFQAGESVAYGMDKEQALASISLNAAKIIGIDKQLGSLEEGKLASLVISGGDLLDIRTNNIELAYIAGKPVLLQNKQTELYNKYKTKYGIK